MESGSVATRGRLRNADDGMRFVLSMAWRDSRRSRRWLLFVSLFIVSGVAALVAIGSVSDNFRQTLGSEGKALLGADLVVSTPSPPTMIERNYCDGIAEAQARELDLSTMMVFSREIGARRIRLHAVDSHFPLYGDLATEPAEAAQQLRQGASVVVVEETFLRRAAAHVGDKVKLGRMEFTIAGTLKRVPGEIPDLGRIDPQAFCPLRWLDATGIPDLNIAIDYRVALRLPPGHDPERTGLDIKREINDPAVSFQTVKRLQRQFSNAIANVDKFLNLVGLIALLLGAVGVASAMHLYIRQKIVTCAILRCLGADARHILLIFAVQALALGAVGSILGALLGIAIQFTIPSILKDSLPLPVTGAVVWPAVAKGAVVGLFLCQFFILFPLLAVRRISPLAALRSALSEDLGSLFGREACLAGLSGALALVALAAWQTHSWATGLEFIGFLGVVGGALAAASRGMTRTGRRSWPSWMPYVLRQGLANLHRPNGGPALLLSSLGLGLFLILTLCLTHATLLRRIHGSSMEIEPNVAFLDIPEADLTPVMRIIADRRVQVMETAPVVTMSILKINGQDSDQARPNRAVNVSTAPPRYRATFRGALTSDEHLVSGKWIGKADAGAPLVPVSVVENMPGVALRLGDEVEWEVEGTPIYTRIASIRAAEGWQSFVPLPILFPEGVLENAPKSYMVAARALAPSDSARLQNAIAGAFPDVLVLDLALSAALVEEIFSKVAFVIEFTTLFTVTTGLMLFAGSVWSSRLQRMRETALLRAMGSTRAMLLRIQAAEHAALGILAALIGGVFAIVANAILARFWLDTTAGTPSIVMLLATSGLSVMITVSTGWAFTRRLTDHPPLEILRQEN